MRPWPAQVAEQLGVCAAGVLEGIGEQGQAVEGAVGVGRFREIADRIAGQRRRALVAHTVPPEWIAEDIS
jgi:hypothetical protein